MKRKIKSVEGNFIRATPSLRYPQLISEINNRKGYIGVPNNLPEDFPNSK